MSEQEKEKLATADVDLKQIGRDSSRSALARYAEVAVGSTSYWQLIKHESILFLCTGLFGAVGIFFRRLLYPAIFKTLGRNVTIGRNVVIRGGTKIRIGDNVMIDDGCVLDARGEGTEIVIGANTLISGGTVIRARNGLLRIGHGCSLGRNCLLGTDSSLEVGDEVLLGAYTYLCAGGVHKWDGPEVSILSQGVLQSRGITIGRGCWLGARTTVLDGVVIGEGSVVGAHSLVNRSLPAMAVAFGQPTRVQRLRQDADGQ